MSERLANADDAKNALPRLNELISSHGEWFYTEAAHAQTIALRRSECDFRVSQGRLIFTCWSEAGARVWRVVGWEWTGDKLLLEAERRMGAENALLELVPRASASVINGMVSATRRTLCERLARLASEHFGKAKVERRGFSAGARRGQPGRYARIYLRRHQERIAVTGIVTESEPGDVDAMLSSALVWFTRARETSSGIGPGKLCLILPSPLIETTRQRLALLREDLRRVIHLSQIDDDWQELTPVSRPTRGDLWKEKPPRLHIPTEKPLSDWSKRLIAHAPEAIDVIRARHGETLRYHGLPFARVRRLMNEEHLWFGASGTRSRRLLAESTQPELTRLIEELKEHRHAGASDHRHALYRSSTEAWLESILRRDITRLDPGLIIAPLHAQFRTSHAGQHSNSRPVDLLALRRDGRLAVIELKVSEDREHVLQGADYWRRVEMYRRHGLIKRARLFEDAVISDEPPLLYLVAPLLRCHRAFETLARAITPDIELYRFDLNEDWRAGVRVMQRGRVN
ncbi:MAG TPA: hypothetical protein VGO91_10835 [Pyrinomonadaceae bacterium]|jgi:hypothetical protein|nr:hypothetical protein [Pyrinomonadaceae bacterium]